MQNPGKRRGTGLLSVEKNVENPGVCHRPRGLKIRPQPPGGFSTEKCGKPFYMPLVMEVILEVMSRMISAVLGSVDTRSSTLRMELSTVA